MRTKSLPVHAKAMEISDDDLIVAVVRVRSAGAAKTAAQTHAALESEGYAVSLSRVKSLISSKFDRSLIDIQARSHG